MQLACLVVSDDIFQGHQQRINVLESLELGLVNVGDDMTAGRDGKIRISTRRGRNPAETN